MWGEGVVVWFRCVIVSGGATVCDEWVWPLPYTVYKVSHLNYGKRPCMPVVGF